LPGFALKPDKRTGYGTGRGRAKPLPLCHFATLPKKVGQFITGNADVPSALSAKREKRCSFEIGNNVERDGCGRDVRVPSIDRSPAPWIDFLGKAAQGRSTKHTKQLEQILSDSILVWLRKELNELA